jgi:hypothetical protein
MHDLEVSHVAAEGPFLANGFDLSLGDDWAPVYALCMPSHDCAVFAESLTQYFFRNACQVPDRGCAEFCQLLCYHWAYAP